MLADLSPAGAAAPTAVPLTLAERLGGWLNWTDAIALSAALNTGMVAPTAGESGAEPPTPDTAFDEATRLRAALALSLTVDVPGTAGTARTPAASPGASRGEDLDFSVCRRAYLTQQRAMESAIAGLRARLRAALAGQSPALARLAALDAALEAALRAPERQLLATVPDVLERHFEHLQQAQAAQWLTRYAADLQAVLRAELALRLQPIDGLLETLRLHLETAGRP